MARIRIDPDPQTTLDRLNRSTLTDEMQKYTVKNELTEDYKKRLRLEGELKKVKSAHRETFMGDCGDVTMKPVLDNICC